MQQRHETLHHSRSIVGSLDRPELGGRNGQGARHRPPVSPVPCDDVRVLDWLADLSRRKGVWVALGVLVTVALVGPALMGGGRGATTSATTTTDPFVGTAPPTSTTTITTPTTSPGTAPSSSGAPTSTSSASTSAPATSSTSAPPGAVTTTTGLTGGGAEVDRPGDPPDPGSRYPGRPDLRPKDQERVPGLAEQPARLSGWSAWVATATKEAKGPDGVTGPFEKITVRLVNRDDAPQVALDDHWTLLRPDGIAQATSYATPSLVGAGTNVPGNGELFGEVWFPVATPGRYWLALRPGADSERGIWAIDVP